MRARYRFFLILLTCFILSCLFVSCGDDDDDDKPGEVDFPDDDDSVDDDDDDDNDDNDDDIASPPPALIPGPDDPGYDPDLEALARMYDRGFHALNAFGLNVNTEATIPVANEDDRALIVDFLQNSDGWDFEAYTGKPVFDVITAYHKVAGLYGGNGIAADAFRYGVLRDQGYPYDEVDIARQHLTAAIKGLEIASEITGVPGVIARGFMRTDIPGTADQIVLTPLFDGYGDPLPPIKNNGTWRADNSEDGLYPEYIWEDSCSRDMYMGWVAAMAAVWEVIKDDPTFPDSTKWRMKRNARNLARVLAEVQNNGYDLEIQDADGRTTYHGYLNENNYDRIYLPFLPFKNGLFAVMSLGALAALSYVAEDPEIEEYLYDHLIGERHLDEIARQNLIGIDLWVWSNYSSVNFTAQGAWLAQRYLQDSVAQENVRFAWEYHLYDKADWHERQPREQKVSLYDFMYASSVAQSTAWLPRKTDFDQTAVANGLETLSEFPTPPYWDYEVINCDEDEIAAGHCLCADGVTEIDLMPLLGRNDTLVSVQPVPMHTQRPSNYHWRSNPYEVNGGGSGSTLLPGVDFRWAYWLGRWVR